MDAASIGDCTWMFSLLLAVAAGIVGLEILSLKLLAMPAVGGLALVTAGDLAAVFVNSSSSLLSCWLFTTRWGPPPSELNRIRDAMLDMRRHKPNLNLKGDEQFYRGRVGTPGTVQQQIVNGSFKAKQKYIQLKMSFE